MLEFINLTKEEASQIIESQKIGNQIALQSLRDYASYQADIAQGKYEISHDIEDLYPSTFLYHIDALLYLYDNVLEMKIGRIKYNNIINKTFEMLMQQIIDRCYEIIDKEN